MKSMKSLICLPILGLLLIGFLSMAQPIPILESPKEAELSIKVWVDKGVYKPGDRINIHFELNQDAFVYVYDIGTQGKVTLLFPTRFSRNNFLKKGTYTLPDKKDYSLVISGPEGTEFIQAIASLSPLDIAPDKFTQDFYTLSTDAKVFQNQLKLQIEKIVPSKGWAAAWTSFQVSRVLGELTIESTPPGALVLIDGNFVGQTPIARIKIKKGLHQIRLVLPGYKDWNMQVTIEAGERERIAAALVPIWMNLPPQASFTFWPLNPDVGETVTFDASSSFDPDGWLVAFYWDFGDGKSFARGARVTHVFSTPGTFTITLIVADNGALTNLAQETILVRQPGQPPTADFSSQLPGPITEHLFLGLNAGTNSLGAELGFDLGTGTLSLGGSVSFTGEEIPKYFDVGSPQEFEQEEIYNDGPELELYIKGGLPITILEPARRILLEAGLGFSSQDRVHIASSSPSQTATAFPKRAGSKLDIEVLPNGYKETKFYLTALGGLAARFGNIFLSLNYHTRRGWIAGAGIALSF